MIAGNLTPSLSMNLKINGFRDGNLKLSIHRIILSIRIKFSKSQVLILEILRPEGLNPKIIHV